MGEHSEPRKMQRENAMWIQRKHSRAPAKETNQSADTPWDLQPAELWNSVFSVAQSTHLWLFVRATPAIYSSLQDCPKDPSINGAQEIPPENNVGKPDYVTSFWMPLWRKVYLDLVILRNCRGNSESCPFVGEVYTYKWFTHSGKVFPSAPETEGVTRKRGSSQRSRLTWTHRGNLALVSWCLLARSS